MNNHNWIKSTLGHGETMCSRCAITNREAAVLGILSNCNVSPIEKYYIVSIHNGKLNHQIWHDEPPVDGNGKFKDQPIFIKKLETDISLDQCILKFMDEVAAVCNTKLTL